MTDWFTLAKGILAPLPTHAGAPTPTTPEPPDAPPKPALMDSQAGGDSCGLTKPPLKDRPSGSPFTLHPTEPRTLPRTLTTTTTVELEVTLTGTYAPGYAATPPSFASAGGEPGEADGVDDITIEKITVTIPDGYYTNADGVSIRKWREVDLTQPHSSEGDRHDDFLAALLGTLSDAETLLLQEVEE